METKNQKFKALTKNVNELPVYFAYWVFGVLDSTQQETIGGCYIDADTVSKFSGRKDKNGIDVYEHDLISIPKNNLIQNGVHEVVQCDGSFYSSCTLFNDNGRAMKCPLEWALDLGSIVIGNKFDNPKLLKGE